MTEPAERGTTSSDLLNAMSGPERLAAFASIKTSAEAISALAAQSLAAIEQQKQRDQAALDLADEGTVAQIEFQDEIDTPDLLMLEDLFQEITTATSEISSILANKP